MYLKHFVFTEVGVKSVNVLMHGLTTTTATFPQNITTVYYILYRNSIQNSCIYASEYTAATATAYIYIYQQHTHHMHYSARKFAATFYVVTAEMAPALTSTAIKSTGPTVLSASWV